MREVTAKLSPKGKEGVGPNRQREVNPSHVEFLSQKGERESTYVILRNREFTVSKSIKES